MTSLILATATRVLLPLLLIFSLFLLLRGHNEPGGGFVGGLVAAAAFGLYAVSYGPAGARQVLRVEPRMLVGAGLLVAGLAGLPALVMGDPFLTGLWDGSVDLFGVLELGFGTPVVFDIGVYMVVLGVTISIILALVEEES